MPLGFFSFIIVLVAPCTLPYDHYMLCTIQMYITILLDVEYVQIWRPHTGLSGSTPGAYTCSSVCFDLSTRPESGLCIRVELHDLEPKVIRVNSEYV